MGSAWNNVATAQKPTNVTHSCVGNFTGPDVRNLIIGKCTHIEVHSLCEKGLQSIVDVPIYGRIATLQLFRPQGESQDSLFITIERYQLCVLQWDTDTQDCYSVRSESVNDQINHRCHSSPEHLGTMAIKWNTNNQHEVVYATDRKLVVYNVDDSQQVSELEIVVVYPYHLCFFTDVDSKSKSLISAPDNRSTVTLLDPKAGNQPICKLNTNDEILSVQFDVQDQYVFAAGNKGIVYVWDIRTVVGDVSYPPLFTWELPLELKRSSLIMISQRRSSHEGEEV